MSVPRQVLPGATYLVTRRCTQRQFLLRPSPRTNDLLLFCLAAAAERYGLCVHAFCFLSNHYHLVVTDPRAALPEAMRYFNELTARALNASYGRWEALWASGTYSAVRLISPEDIVAKIAYTLANPVAAGLVPRAERWPGLVSLPHELDGGARTALRPKTFFRPDGPLPETCTLRLTRPTGFDDRASFVADVATALRAAEDKAAAGVRARGGAFLGAGAIVAQRPTDSPATFEPRRGLNPRIAARDRWKRIEAIFRLREFLAAYRAARDALLAGLRDVVFPSGTYLLRVRHGVVCAAP